MSCWEAGLLRTVERRGLLAGYVRVRDDWVRISWDEALDLTASEIRRIKEAYGNTSILFPGNGSMRRVFSLYGGLCRTVGRGLLGNMAGNLPARYGGSRHRGR